MKKLLKTAGALLCALGLTSLASAQMTTVTASKISMGGIPISAGTVTFTPVNAMGVPIAFATGGGGLNSPTAFSCSLTAGALTGSCQIPDAALTSPANILYAIQITNTATQKAFTLQAVANVTGSTWALDAYGPPASTSGVQTMQASIGSVVPSSCVMPSVFTKTSSPTGLYYCLNGTFVASGNASGGTTYTGTSPINVSDGAVSIQTATDSQAGAMSATDHAALTAVQVTAAAALAKTGGAMTGPLALAADPTSPLQAADKNYVDTHSTPNPVAGASAEYPMLDGSGTTVTDVSGSGNNATFGTSAPTWYSYGVAFNDAGFQHATPEIINTPITTLGAFYIAHCTPNMGQNSGTATGGTNLVSQFQPFTGTSVTTGGLILAGSGTTWNTEVAIIPSIITVPGFALPTNLPNGFGGCHVYGYSINSPTDSKDHITIDGVEQAVYNAQGSSASFESISGGGFYRIGADPFSNGLRGVVSYAIYYPTSHTIAQMQAVTQYIQGKLALRPTFPHYPVLSNAIAPQLIFAGDSLTAAYRGTSQWTAAVTPNVAYTITNWGIQSMSAFDVCQLSDQRWAQTIVPGQSTVHFWAGTNDFVYAATAPHIWAALSTCASKAHKLGARAIISTMISGTGRDTNKNALNALIRSQWKQVGFDHLNDLASVPALGADGAYSNTACYQSDNVHLTGPGVGTCGTVGATALSGYGIVAALATAAINTMDGSSSAYPDTTTSNAFASTYANNFVIQTPTAAATYSLVDCQGQSSPRTIVNGSGSYVITVGAINSQAIAGSATVAANTTATFMPVLTGPTTGGCSWFRTQ